MKISTKTHHSDEASSHKRAKYFLYTRKSSESEDRQVQSIEDQHARLEELAKELSLDVIEVYAESKSAKKPGRPLFDKMLERIENGEAEGILCWQINRLSRNPIDSGKIQWLLQQGILKKIQTIDREYLPEDNVLIFNVESGVANQYILDLRKNVERSIQSKLSKGWMPSTAPQGYLNTKTELRGENYIVKDPDRLPLIIKAWGLMLTGNYTPPKILEKMNTEWGYRVRASKRRGGRPMGYSSIYRMFTNPFYAGYIRYRGELYQGQHEAIITLEEFDRVQELLGRKGKPRPKKHAFAFTGCIRCGECGCLLTAIEKKKLIKKDNKIKTFTYYYCTRKKKDINCSQHKHITLKDLEQQIDKEIQGLTILPEFLDWALEGLNQSNDKEIEDRSKIHENLSKNLLSTQSELDELTKMRYRKLINDETFMKDKKDLEFQIKQLKEKLHTTEDRAERWIELTEQTFNFATYARKAFLFGDLQTKKEILIGLGQNPIAKDGKLAILANEWLQPIENVYPALEQRYKKLEPYKDRMNTTQREDWAAVRSEWRTQGDLNP